MRVEEKLEGDVCKYKRECECVCESEDDEQREAEAAKFTRQRRGMDVAVNLGVKAESGAC